MKAKVSIVIPIYNIRNYLFDCLRSVLEQTLQEIEIICVNDGSTDGSKEIIEYFSKLDGRIKVIDKENGGLGAARNSGFDLATGKYVVFLDGDDLLAPKACEKIYENGERYGSELILLGVWNYYSRFDYADTFQNSHLYLLASEKSPFIISDFPKLMLTHSVWSRAYSREFLQKNNLRNPEQRFAEDMLFSYKAALFSKKISVVSENLYFYRQNRTGSLLDLEKKDDNYKLCYIDTAIEVRQFLSDFGAPRTLVGEFLSNVFRWSPIRQDTLVNYGNFKKFFNSMQKLIGKDYLLVSLEDEKGSKSKKLKFYLACLKLNLPLLYYLIVNFKKNFKY